VYWEWVNDNGGIGGYDIELVTLDSGYATDKGIENYEELAQESDEGVLMITENTGSPITAAVAEDAVISQLVDSGATMVWTVVTPGELSDVFGGAVGQGFEAVWSGNGPSFSYPVHLSSDLAEDFDEYYWQSGYAVPWNGNDSEGMQEMVSVMTERRPDATLSDQYLTGWIEGIMAQTIIEQAIANGDLTRAGVVEASTQVEIDMKGPSPNQSYGGTYDENIVRESYIFDVRADEFDLQPLSVAAGGTGLVVEEGPYTAAILADYEFGGACI